MDGFDGSVEGQELARRRKLLDVMSQQVQGQTLVGRSGPTQAITKMLTQLLLDKQDGQIGADRKTGSDAYGVQLGNESRDYMDRYSGKPGQQMSVKQVDALMNNDQAPQLANPIKADPREAIVQAMTSRMPEMQALGKAGMTSLAKQEAEKFGHTPVMMKGPNDKMVSVLMGDRGTVKPVEGFDPAIKKEATAGGNIWNPYSGEQEGYVGSVFTPPGVIGKDADGKPMIGQTEMQSGKINPLDKADHSVRINNSPSTLVAAQKAGTEHWSKKAADAVTEMSEQARGAVKVLSQANQLEALNKSGTAQGPLANPAVWLGQLATSAGVKLDPQTQAKLQNSETFNNTATELWLSTMNANGGSRGLVKEESERIASSLPSMMQTQQGRAQILAVMRAKAQQQISDAKQAQQEYGQALNTQDFTKFTFGLGSTQLPNTTPTPVPAAGVAPGGSQQPMSFDEYIRTRK